MAEMAPRSWGIPIVRSTTDRDTRFPAPATDQRVQNMGTNATERWDGTAWLVESFGSSATQFDVRASAFGGTGNGTTDDRGAFVRAQTACGTAGAVYVSPGTYRIASNLTITSALTRAPGALLKPDTGVTITISSTIDPPGPFPFFDLSAGGTVTVAPAPNPTLHAEWWGAVPQPVSGTNDDTHAITNRKALLAATACLAGNSVKFNGIYVIDQPITFPNSSWALDASGPTLSGLRAATTTPTITLYDFSGCNGPGKSVHRLYAVNPEANVTGGTGFSCNGSNGILFDHCWAGAMTIGWDLAGSYNSGVGNTAELCGIGIRRIGAASADECQWSDTVFQTNGIDEQLAGDCTGFQWGPSNHSSASNSGACLDLNAATHVQLAGPIINTGGANASLTVNIRGSSDDVHLGRVVVSGGDRGVQVLLGTNVTIDALEMRGGGTYALQTQNNGSTANVRVRYLRVLGAANGDTGVVNVSRFTTIEDFSITGCTTGINDGAEDLALLHGECSGNTTNFVMSATLDRCKVVDVTSDAFGPFVSSLAGAANRINAIYSLDPEGRKVCVGTAAPTSGAWVVGDRVIQRTPASGSPKGWRCTVAGTPGTWVSEGNL